MTTAVDETCRLCHSPTVTAFSATIVGDRHISYYLCQACGSLQTEKPYWLDDVYDSHLGDLDLGVVQRNISNQAVCYLVAHLWNLHNAIDYGGGDGLLCRMVRDHRINCFVSDKYGQPTYAQRFTRPDFGKPDVVFSFEVFEHFADPQMELSEVFCAGAPVVLASTGIYHGQAGDWPYLSLASGRHVFFYSARAIHLIAERFGYMATIAGGYILFTRPSAVKRIPLAIFRLLTSRPGLRFLRAIIALLPARGVAFDARAMQGRSRDPTGEAMPTSEQTTANTA